MKNIFLAVIIIILISCNNETPTSSKKPITKVSKIELDTTNFGYSTHLDSNYLTQFSPTLESKIDTNKNSIYAASLLFAWDELRKTLKHPITNIKSKQLKELNNSESFRGVLFEDEYLTEVTISENEITSKAYFKILLPFYEHLDTNLHPLKFNNQLVENFGFSGEHHTHRILYYNTDKDFTIILKPKNREHSIYLYYPEQTDSTLNGAWQTLHKKYNDFKKHLTRETYWKREFTKDDKVAIPNIDFNLKTSYKNIEGTSFIAQNEYWIKKAFQQTAFQLNEKGAKVESFAEIAVEEAHEPFQNNKPTPKQMIFNRPFYIFLKSRDSQFPYFAAYIKNTEFMKVQQNQEIH